MPPLELENIGHEILQEWYIDFSTLFYSFPHSQGLSSLINILTELILEGKSYSCVRPENGNQMGEKTTMIHISALKASGEPLG